MHKESFDFAAVDKYIHDHIRDWMGELSALCAVPSVSARHEAIEPCADAVAELLSRRGFKTQVTSVDGGHPVVLGHASGSSTARTMLFYNHYDVQPPEPLALWESPPFELTEREGAVYARGAKDDKGELVARLAAIDGPDGRIRVPSCYDAVRMPTAAEEAVLSRLPDTAENFRREFGLDQLLDGVTDVERAYFTPTANIAGIGAGYQGEGSKTVIPAQAMAKMDFRLVPDQDPMDVLDKLRKHLRAEGFGDIAIEVLGAQPPGLTDPDAPIVRLTAEVANEVYGKPALIVPLTGGTTPMYLFTSRGVPVVSPGVGWGSRNRAHSPNEFMRLVDFENAARHIARLLARFAAT